LKLSRLEVSIQQKRSRYIATSPLFPTCKGLGVTEALALRQLSNSIGRFIAKTTADALNEVLVSEDYTELISPVSSSTDADTVNRIYSFENSAPFGQQGYSESKAHPVQYALEDLVEDNVRDLIQSEIDMVLEEGSSSLLGRSPRYRQDDEGAFGILMSLN
jgi:hypothetical protein